MTTQLFPAAFKAVISVLMRNGAKMKALLFWTSGRGETASDVLVHCVLLGVAQILSKSEILCMQNERQLMHVQII